MRGSRHTPFSKYPLFQGYDVDLLLIYHGNPGVFGKNALKKAGTWSRHVDFWVSRAFGAFRPRPRMGHLIYGFRAKKIPCRKPQKPHGMIDPLEKLVSNGFNQGFSTRVSTKKIHFAPKKQTTNGFNQGFEAVQTNFEDPSTVSNNTDPRNRGRMDGFQPQNWLINHQSQLRIGYLSIYSSGNISQRSSSEH